MGKIMEAGKQTFPWAVLCKMANLCAVTVGVESSSMVGP